MDPNENIKRQRELAESIVALNGCIEIRETGKPRRAMWDYAPELAELVLALDEWLASGGFKPERCELMANENLKLARSLVSEFLAFHKDDEDIAVNGYDRRNRERLVRHIARVLKANRATAVGREEG